MPQLLIRLAIMLSRARLLTNRGHRTARADTGGHLCYATRHAFRVAVDAHGGAEALGPVKNSSTPAEAQ